MESISEVHLAEGCRHFVVAPEHQADITVDWFYPAWWGNNAQPVAAGGRGGAWFIGSPLGDAVLRQYRRGGLVARLSESSYFFTGYNHSRSFAEFRLLQMLHAKGLPVPEPLAAMVQRQGAFRYKAWIILRRLTDAKPLPEVDNVAESSLWFKVGQVIRRFHDVGLNHVDLNCDNILVSGSGIYLIDFDRCQLRENDSPDAGWKAANLSRLQRSVAKRCQTLSSAARECVWQALMEGYGG